MREHPPIRYLVLWVTGRCNLDCRYCYRGDIGATGTLDLETAERALDIAASSGQRFHLQLTGGEPCLEPVLVERILSRARALGSNASVGLQSNGTLIDDALARLFSRYQVYVGLSIDGVQQVHEAHRQEFAATVRGLSLLGRYAVPCRVTAVVTRESAPHLDRLALMLAGFANLRGLGLDLLTRKGNAVVHDVSSTDPAALQKGASRLLETLELINRNRRPPLVLRELNQYRKGALSVTGPMPCHAIRGESMAVLPDGRVYPCSQTSGDSDFFCGTVDRVEREQLRVLESGPDCPGRTHYNRGESLALQQILLRCIATHCTGRRAA